MKTVYFVRHAKSSWKDAMLQDIDRPLNDRGKRDAPFMAKLLREQGLQPDKLISSPAKRAFATAKYFAEAFDISQKDILVVEDIYEAHPAEILQVVRNCQPEWNTVLIFGHNPTFTDVVNFFADQYILNVPTCGIARVELTVDDWSEFDKNTAKLTAFHYPKQYFN